MKKLLTIIMLLSTAAFLSRAEDSYLYWMVDATEAEWWLDSFTYATIKETSTGEYLVDRQYGVDAVAANDDGLTTAAVDFIMPTAYMSSEYSFIVELYNENDSLLGWSRAVNFDELIDHIFSGMQPTGANPYVFSAIIPEPTSGMLLLFGLAGLALRRKRGLVGRSPRDRRGSRGALGDRPLPRDGMVGADPRAARKI